MKNYTKIGALCFAIFSLCVSIAGAWYAHQTRLQVNVMHKLNTDSSLHIENNQPMVEVSGENGEVTIDWQRVEQEAAKSKPNANFNWTVAKALLAVRDGNVKTFDGK